MVVAYYMLEFSILIIVGSFHARELGVHRSSMSLPIVLAIPSMRSGQLLKASTHKSISTTIYTEYESLEVHNHLELIRLNHLLFSTHKLRHIPVTTHPSPREPLPPYLSEPDYRICRQLDGIL